MELEHDGYGPQSAIAELVDALNRDRGAQGDWRFVEAGNGPGDNPIRVGIIYRGTRLQPPRAAGAGVPGQARRAVRGGRQPLQVEGLPRCRRRRRRPQRQPGVLECYPRDFGAAAARLAADRPDRYRCQGRGAARRFQCLRHGRPDPHPA
ncbi:hypothetical protein G6F59_016195 [Rhizopus arrhizus]|nr:hypothetical protein G6F59_016195 [Rhizopus arrhizus]